MYNILLTICQYLSWKRWLSAVSVCVRQHALRQSLWHGKGLGTSSQGTVSCCALFYLSLPIWNNFLSPWLASCAPTPLSGRKRNTQPPADTTQSYESTTSFRPLCLFLQIYSLNIRMVFKNTASIHLFIWSSKSFWFYYICNV